MSNFNKLTKDEKYGIRISRKKSMNPALQLFCKHKRPHAVRGKVYARLWLVKNQTDKCNRPIKLRVTNRGFAGKKLRRKVHESQVTILPCTVPHRSKVYIKWLPSSPPLSRSQLQRHLLTVKSTSVCFICYYLLFTFAIFWILNE